MRNLQSRVPANAVCHLTFESILILAFAFGLPVSAAVPAQSAVIDDCQYSGDAAAQAAWRPMRGSAPVATATLDGRKVLRLPCSFAGGNIERASWDRAVKLDLSSSRGIQFKVLCRKALPVSYFSLYFQSGEGWYQAAFFPESSTDWNTIEIEKSEMKSEGKPAGWNQITAIRVSAWRGKAVSTEFYLSDLRQIEPLPPAGPRELAEAAISRIGRIAGFKTYEEATNQVAASAGQNARLAKALASAATLRESALKLAGQQRFTEAMEQAAAAREQLVQAFCLSQKSLPGEFRGFWCHGAFGVQGVDWDEAIRRLADNGFTAILPNMLWGGAAFYESKVLPVAAQAAARGDQIRQCLAACRKYGVQIHVWKVDWNLGSAAPKDFVARMRQAGRLQASSGGKEEPWLCPSHPDNQQLEIAAMVEIVRNYDVDGIHFDYIRYPDGDHCFCAGCQERFQRASGATLTNWPAGVLADGPLRQQWLEWRRGNITTVVRTVSEQARAVKPKIKLSAAVFQNWAVDRDSVGQDWKLWCDKGYLDFVCPMDYTPSNNRFEAMVDQQVEWAGRIPCYPGIGVSASSSRLGVDRTIEQINLTRRYQTHGFVIFNYGVKESDELLPMLGLGITAKPQPGSAR
jgi:uncharacterized lipoprotein YddW (UPF0748 family)